MCLYLHPHTRQTPPAKMSQESHVLLKLCHWAVQLVTHGFPALPQGKCLLTQVKLSRPPCARGHVTPLSCWVLSVFRSHVFRGCVGEMRPRPEAQRGDLPLPGTRSPPPRVLPQLPPFSPHCHLLL